jgi:hypothetical protein
MPSSKIQAVHAIPLQLHPAPSPQFAQTYARVYALSHAFFPEPLTCAAFTNAILTGAVADGNPCGVYRRVVLAIRARKERTQPVPACSQIANFTWLLKDVADLSYAEIGEALQMETDEVRQQIAEVREAVLDWLEEEDGA